MNTGLGKLTTKSVMKRIFEYREIGHSEFLDRYANSRNSKSTWISYEGELFPAKAIYAAAHKPLVQPKSFNTSHTYEFSRELGFEIVRIENGELTTSRSAINDLDELAGGEPPRKNEFSGERYIRNPKVRSAVRLRSKGSCEYCGKSGFMTVRGRPYIETHHIISLSNQGADSTANVIALCADDHRQAHFGENSEELELAFQEILARIVS